MRKLLAAAVAATCISLHAMPGVAQQADETPTVKTTAIKGELHLLQGRGGNVVASVGADGVLIIDDDYPQYATAYEEALADLAGAEASARFVLNTHWHGDHTGGNQFWGERGAVIVAHDNVRQRMATRQEMKAFNNVVEPSPAAALPVVTYADSLALHFNGDDIEVQHYPKGHTDGDSVIFFTGANVVHMGDHYFKDVFPFVDLGSGGNVFSFTANIKSILDKVDADTVIVPGHGDIATKADLERYYRMLTTTSAMVKDKLANGMDVAELTRQGLGDEWKSWGTGFIDEARWISFIADSR